MIILPVAVSDGRMIGYDIPIGWIAKAGVESFRHSFRVLERNLVLLHLYRNLTATNFAHPALEVELLPTM